LTLACEGGSVRGRSSADCSYKELVAPEDLGIHLLHLKGSFEGWRLTGRCGRHENLKCSCHTTCSTELAVKYVEFPFFQGLWFRQSTDWGSDHH